MLARILWTVGAFVVATSLLDLAVTFLIFRAGLSGVFAMALSACSAVIAMAVSWRVWVRSGRTRLQAAPAGASDSEPTSGWWKSPRRRLPLLVLGLVSIFGGCTSWPLPPSLTAEQRDVVQRTHIGGTVGVYRAPFATQSDEIMEIAIREIAATGQFDRVDRLSNLNEPPTYRMEFRGMHWCSDTFPKPWLILSLGIIPATEGACGGVSLRLYRGEESRFVTLNSWFKEKAIHGWLAMLFNLSPNRTWGWDLPEKRGHPRFAERLAWIIASSRQEIEQLP